MNRLEVQLNNSRPMRLDARFDCAAGELIALVGPSGGGKTSLLRAIAGLLQAPGLQGRLSLGNEVWFDSALGINLPPQQRCVGLVFQHYALFPHLSALANVMIGSGPLKSRPQWQMQAEILLQRLGLTGLEQRRPAELSGGQQQRVALARALMRVASSDTTARERPGVLLLDEPFSAVDAPTRQTLYRELASLRQHVSTPMVLVTHDLAEARRLADRVVIVDAGTSLQSGPPAKVFASPRNARVADLVGIQNHFRGTFLRQPRGWGLLRWEDDQGHTLDLSVIDKNRLDDGVSVTWVVAGEHLDVTHDEGVNREKTPGNNPVPCALTELLALGETSLCGLQPLCLPGVKLTLNLSTALLRRLQLQLGSQLLVQLPATAIHIMPQRN